MALRTVRVWLHLASYKEDKQTRPKMRLVINFCCNFLTLFLLCPVPLLHFARLCITAALLTPKETLTIFNYNSWYNVPSDDCN